MKNTTLIEMQAHIDFASTKPELNKLEELSERLYNMGLLTPSELGRLDVRIMEKLAIIQD